MNNLKTKIRIICPFDNEYNACKDIQVSLHISKWLFDFKNLKFSKYEN
jgi:hypothetical protein